MNPTSASLPRRTAAPDQDTAAEATARAATTSAPGLARRDPGTHMVDGVRTAPDAPVVKRAGRDPEAERAMMDRYVSGAGEAGDVQSGSSSAREGHSRDGYSRDGHSRDGRREAGMSTSTGDLGTQCQRFNDLLSMFAADTPEVIDVIAVSAEGLLIATANPLDRASADRCAAITSAIIGLAHGASRVYDLGSPNKVIIDFAGGFLLVSSIAEGSTLGVLATRAADLGRLAYELAVLANRADAVITAELIEELQLSVAF